MNRILIGIGFLLGFYSAGSQEKPVLNYSEGDLCTQVVVYPLDSLKTTFFYDGPHVYWQPGKKHAKVKYYSFSPIKKRSKKHVYKWEVKPTDTVLYFEGKEHDKNKYSFLASFQNTPSEYTGVGKILVIGDVHGEYDRLVNILRIAGVVDSLHNWIFGKGHVVFTGDIVDRGEQVTESLWFIYNLTQNANLSGGKVHFLLGNHEIMLFEKDVRYLNVKYSYLASKYNFSYRSQFSNKTVLGRWMRSLNSVITINDILFVHAGISAEVAKYNVSIDSINWMVRKYLNRPNFAVLKGVENLTLGVFGPLWYRGYLVKMPFYAHITEEEVDLVLEKYGVNQIVFGHTGLKDVTPIFNNKLINIDVPFKEHCIPLQVLLIEDKKYTVVFEDGSRKNLFQNSCQ